MSVQLLNDAVSAKQKHSFLWNILRFRHVWSCVASNAGLIADLERNEHGRTEIPFRNSIKGAEKTKKIISLWEWASGKSSVV
jgi:hypothetical protein